MSRADIERHMLVSARIPCAEERGGKTERQRANQEKWTGQRTKDTKRTRTALNDLPARMHSSPYTVGGYRKRLQEAALCRCASYQSIYVTEIRRGRGYLIASQHSRRYRRANLNPSLRRRRFLRSRDTKRPNPSSADAPPPPPLKKDRGNAPDEILLSDLPIRHEEQGLSGTPRSRSIAL